MAEELTKPSQVGDQPNPRQGAEGTPNASAVEHRRFTISREQLEGVKHLQNIAQQGTGNQEAAVGQNNGQPRSKVRKTGPWEPYNKVYQKQTTGPTQSTAQMARAFYEEKAQATTSP